MAMTKPSTSTPDAQRRRPKAHWTIARAVIEAADRRARETGAASTSAWVEALLARELGVEAPARMTPERARALVAEHGSARKAATEVGVAVSTITRAAARVKCSADVA